MFKDIPKIPPFLHLCVSACSVGLTVIAPGRGLSPNDRRTTRDKLRIINKPTEMLNLTRNRSLCRKRKRAIDIKRNIAIAIIILF